MFLDGDWKNLTARISAREPELAELGAVVDRRRRA
jgi:hypothetical protein